jgi:hypothetical protein
VPHDLLSPSFGNVAVPPQIFPSIDIDLSRGVAYCNSRIFSRAAAMRSRAPLSPSSILTAANKPQLISTGLPRRPARTGTTASGSAGAASKASMSRSIRLGAIRGTSPSRMTAPRAVSLRMSGQYASRTVLIRC